MEPYETLTDRFRRQVQKGENTMTERDTLIHYLSRLSDKRIHSLLSCARSNYAAQKDSEPATLTETSLCAGILADLKEEYLHMVYVAAKALHDIQTGKETQTDA